MMPYYCTFLTQTFSLQWMRGVLREWRGLIITGPDRGISPLNMSRAKCTRNINNKKVCNVYLQNRYFETRYWQSKRGFPQNLIVSRSLMLDTSWAWLHRESCILFVLNQIKLPNSFYTKNISLANLFETRGVTNIRPSPGQTLESLTQSTRSRDTGHEPGAQHSKSELTVAREN